MLPAATRARDLRLGLALVLFALFAISLTVPTDGSTPAPADRTQSAGAPLRYLGQTPPGDTPLRFAPGIVSTPAIEINAAFRPRSSSG